MDKIRLNHALRSHAKLSLGEAKRVVDKVLAEDTVEVQFPDEATAHTFLQEANKVGARGYIVGEVGG